MKTTGVLFFSFAVLLFSCKPDVIYTIEGRFLKECFLSAEGVDVKLYDEQINTGNPILLGTTITDSLGFFTFHYTGEQGAPLLLRTDNMEIKQIPTRQNLDLGTRYDSGTFNLRLSLLAEQSMSSADTLFYWCYDMYDSINGVQIIPGPFASGVVRTIENYRLNPTHVFGNSPAVRFGYKVNNSNTRYDEFAIVPCNGSFVEAVLVIE